MGVLHQNGPTISTKVTSALLQKRIGLPSEGNGVDVQQGWSLPREVMYRPAHIFNPASFNADINGTTLDVARVMFAHLRLGDTVQGDGVTSCVIRSMDTGTGGSGTYTVSISQSVRTRTLMTATHGIQPHELDLADVGPP